MSWDQDVAPLSWVGFSGGLELRRNEFAPRASFKRSLAHLSAPSIPGRYPRSSDSRFTPSYRHPFSERSSTSAEHPKNSFYQRPSVSSAAAFEGRKQRKRDLGKKSEGAVSSPNVHLGTDPVISKPLDDAEMARNNALSELSSSRSRVATARQQLARTTVRAPFDGIVSERKASHLTSPAWPFLPSSASNNDHTKVMLVFDCNGTLTSLSKKRRKTGFGVRPGVGCLAELAKSNRFSLALWTSAMKNNLDLMQAKVEAVSQIKFDCSLDRSNCRPARSKILRKNRYETVKPLETYFGRYYGPGLSKVILIDDNPDKVMPSEEKNLLLVPAWDENQNDTVLRALVDGLLKLDCSRDVRPQIKDIESEVWSNHRKTLVSSQTSESSATSETLLVASDASTSSPSTASQQPDLTGA